MKHYLKLYFASIKASISCRLEFKGDLLIGIFGFIFENVCSILSIYFIVNSIPELRVPGQGIWTIWQIAFLYGFSMLPKSVDHLFTDELWLVSYRRVTDGTLDKYFLRPSPILFSVISETFQPEGLSELIVGIALIIVSLCNPSVQIVINSGTIALALVAIIFGAMIISSFKIIFAGLAFVLKRTGQGLQIVYNALTFVKYPKNIYPYFIRIILLSIIPFGLIVSLPCEIFLGYLPFNPWLLSLIIICSACLLLFISILIWSICCSKYESTGN